MRHDTSADLRAARGAIEDRKRAAAEWSARATALAAEVERIEVDAAAAAVASPDRLGSLADELTRKREAARLAAHAADTARAAIDEAERAAWKAEAADWRRRATEKRSELAAHRQVVDPLLAKLKELEGVPFAPKRDGSRAAASVAAGSPTSQGGAVSIDVSTASRSDQLAAEAHEMEGRAVFCDRKAAGEDITPPTSIIDGSPRYASLAPVVPIRSGR